jgi:uncharacterized protein (DUF433 family)
MRREPRGAYGAPRAAALSGVPLSTVHYWARKEYLVPSVSAERIKLWSWADLMGLRLIYWLRQAKETEPGREVPASSMPTVQRALASLRDLDMALWSEDGGPAVAVDRDGSIVLKTPEYEQTPDGQALMHETLDLVEPFPTEEGTRGPHLIRPRPTLRIVPGKLAGSPHIEDTRIETVALAALAARGMEEPKIARLYPMVSNTALREALDLEGQLRRNINEPPLPIAA